MLGLLGASLALAADGDDGARSGDSGQVEQLNASPIPANAEEIPAERTATSRTYELPSGAKAAEIFQTPINYREPDGDWKPIDTSLHDVANGTGIANGPNSFDLLLPGTMGSGPVRVSEGEQWVSYRLLGSSADLTDRDSRAVTYESASGEVAFELTSLPTGVKEEIQLADPDAPSRYAFELNASAGLTPRIAEDGSVRFEDREDKAFAVLPAPTIEDAEDRSPVAGAVEYELVEAAQGTWRLTVSADAAWLADPERAWPVTIDPTVALGQETFGEVGIASTPAPNGAGTYGSQAQWLPVAYNFTEGAKGRILYKFNTSNIPAAASVYDATFSVYSGGSPMFNTPALETRKMTRGWTLGTDWTRAVNFFGETKWTTPGGDFDTGGYAVVKTSERGTGSGWWNFKSEGLTDLVAAWRSGKAPNYGLLLKQSLESNSECGGCNPPGRFVQMATSSNSTVERRPKLVVSYWEPAPAAAKITSPLEGSRTPKWLRLKAAWPEVNGVTGIKYQWREGPKETFRDIPISLIKTADGKTLTSWSEASTKGQESPTYFFDVAHTSVPFSMSGGPVEVRAILIGPEPGIGGYTPTVKATVDRNLGSGRDAAALVGPGSLDLLTGNLNVTRTDVSIPAFNSTLEFSRTINSKKPLPLMEKGGEEKPTPAGVLGWNWEPAVAVEAAGGSEWQKLYDATAAPEEEAGEYVLVTALEGFEVPFFIEGGNYVPHPELPGWKLVKEGATFAMTDPGGTRTVFQQVTGSATDYAPVSVSVPGGTGNTTKMDWNFLGGGKKRLKMVIAPTPPGAPECTPANATSSTGCKALELIYGQPPGVAAKLGERLLLIVYHAPGFGGSTEVSRYAYDENGNLIAQWDPRISPELKETYAYTNALESKYGGALKTLTPPGLKPWTMEYGQLEGSGPPTALKAVKRDSLLEGTPVAQTTIAYGVPVSGGGAPYPMGPTDVEKWAQTDIPLDATAIFPADEIPANPPSSYSRATVYYMDAEGYGVNTATPKGAGTEAASISTAETDMFGNVVRELTPQNRLRALAKESLAEKKSLAEILSTTRNYSADGIEMQEEFGPRHQVRLESGELVQARAHTTIQYDQLQSGETLPTPAPHLPTKVTTGASVEGNAVDPDQRVTETRYNWTLRQPRETIVDPGVGKLNITNVTVYDNETGLPTEVRQPSNPEGGGAGTTKTTYWKYDASAGICSGVLKYAGLPCLVEPAAQPGTEGQPQVKVTKFAAYNQLGQPTELWEAPGKTALEAGTPRRTTATTWDDAGRPLTVKRTGGGTTVPIVKAEYSSTTGLPTTRRFDCSSGGCEGSDDQAVTTTFDGLGRAIEYEDADGNTSEVTYDLVGRPVTTNDGKGTQTRTYDPTSGLLVELEDSAAGTFTAAYDADGNLIAEGLPNGLVAESTYDEAGQLIGLAYDKSGSKWLDFDAERSISGQILWQKSLTSHQQYKYDKAGRLVQTKDWDAPTSGNCTTREYVFDNKEGSPGKNSNRSEMFSRASGVGGACVEAGGLPQKYEYDAADRLTGESIVYDDWGRITNLPAAFAGGKALTTSYFSTDMVSAQSQNGVTNTFELDAELRQRQRIQGGGLEGVEVFHYAGGSDTPAWSQLGTQWSRSISGIGGGIGAIQDSGSGTLLQLTNLHGDIVATASLSPSATKPITTYDYDEFGVPKQAATPQLGWLGGKGRRTEFATGVVQMGKRSYVPSLGLFISVDPIRGGSASAYDYANADPVNGLDLTGEAACQIHDPEFKVTPRVNRTGNWNFHARAHARCTKAAKNVRVKAVIVGGSIQTGPTNFTRVNGQQGPPVECGNGGPRSWCEMTASTSVNGLFPACGETWGGYFDVMFFVSWEARSGRRMKKRVHEEGWAELKGVCDP